MTELAAWQPRPPDRVLAFLDPLFGRAAPIVERDNALSRAAQVGDDESDARIQLARMPLDLGDHAARLGPTSVTPGVAARHARLASGWRAAPLPGGSRTRWIATRGFSSCHPPPQGAIITLTSQGDNCPQRGARQGRRTLGVIRTAAARERYTTCTTCGARGCYTAWQVAVSPAQSPIGSGLRRLFRQTPTGVVNGTRARQRQRPRANPRRSTADLAWSHPCGGIGRGPCHENGRMKSE